MVTLQTALLLSILSFILPSENGHTDPPGMVKGLDKDLPFLLEFYKTLHRNPEISLQEKETAATLTRELRSIGFEVTENFGGFGIVGMLRNGEGPTILYRTDMDALPMSEKTGLDYASQQVIEYNGGETGAMHSCGHDMHMTTWLGTARAMVRMQDQWSGTLMFIGQPAEEIGKGARLMLDAGLYRQFGTPDYGLALHCDPGIPAGKVGFGKGYTMANTEMIDIIVKGVGAHGASPHQSIDPVVLASMMVMEFQTIVSRNLKPTEPAVVTVGAIKGGTKHNIIPDEVTLQLTVRTFTEDARQLVHRRIREIARGTAIAAGVSDELLPEVIIPESFTPANYNDPALVDRLWQSAAVAIGKEQIVETEPLMIGEDFSCYGQTPEHIPTVLFWLGTVPEQRIGEGVLPGLHSPFYYPDPEPSLRTGITVMTQSLIDLLDSE